jgi:hypothetical protein
MQSKYTVTPTNGNPPFPMLTIDNDGIWFDGVNYEDDLVAAKRARDVYYGKDADDLKDVL